MLTRRLGRRHQTDDRAAGRGRGFGRDEQDDRAAGRGRGFGRDEQVSRGRFGRGDRGNARGAATDGARYALARLITAVAGIAAAIIVAGIVLILLKANPENAIVDAIREAARWLAQPFDVIFEIERRRIEIAVNWGLAALVYVVVAGLIARLLVR